MEDRKNKVGIRKATLVDKEGIYRLMIELEEEELDKKAFSEIYKSNIANPQVVYLVYEEEERLLGFISIHIQKLLHHVATIAEVQELIVNESLRGKGIGRRLFDEAKNVAKANGCLQLEVCCNQKRKASHLFYEAQGMKNSHYKFCSEEL